MVARYEVAPLFGQQFCFISEVLPVSAQAVCCRVGGFSD